MAEEAGAKKEVVKIFGNDKLSDRMNVFQKQVEKNKEYQKRNPFSSSFKKNDSNSTGGSTEVTSAGLTKDDPRYGRPPEGSKTEMRGFKAHNHISKEILELCSVIRQIGVHKDDGCYIVTFGELFQTYTVISNKVVGILLRARKYGLVDFEGEMLFQRRDDNKIITLFPTGLSDEEEDEEVDDF
ncbi:Actin-binding Rho-activating protein [Orchesella cincta]|uniref:Actin-binding Rho-activating protein n=1 Tax=Orchesella cincta TaxID=48709 RepID=A0A1D2N0H5_ORCCI|nr:Actin-binding Rho-activating protein [Orchesella cincta]